MDTRMDKIVTRAEQIFAQEGCSWDAAMDKAHEEARRERILVNIRHAAMLADKAKRRAERVRKEIAQRNQPFNAIRCPAGWDKVTA